MNDNPDIPFIYSNWYHSYKNWLPNTLIDTLLKGVDINETIEDNEEVLIFNLIEISNKLDQKEAVIIRSLIRDTMIEDMHSVLHDVILNMIKDICD